MSKQDEEYVYFELNNWWPGSCYPNVDPFKTWCGNDLCLSFEDEDWVKENQLCVVSDLVDMSINWCITAKKSWVEKYCPELLTKYTNFVRTRDEDGHVYGQWGHIFKEYSDENIGIEYLEYSTE